MFAIKQFEKEFESITLSTGEDEEACKFSGVDGLKLFICMFKLFEEATLFEFCIIAILLIVSVWVEGIIYLNADILLKPG